MYTHPTKHGLSTTLTTHSQTALFAYGTSTFSGVSSVNPLEDALMAWKGKSLLSGGGHTGATPPGSQNHWSGPSSEAIHIDLHLVTSTPSVLAGCTVN